MRAHLLLAFVTLAIPFVASCASSPQSVKLARIEKMDISINKISFEPELVGKSGKTGNFTDETIAITKVKRAILDQYLQVNRSRVVELIKREFLGDEELDREIAKNSIPKYEALIGSLKDVFEKGEDPDVVYKRTKARFGEKGRFLNESNWNAWLNNVRKKGLESQILRIQKLMETDRKEAVSGLGLGELERRIHDVDYLRLFANVQMKEDLGASPGRKISQAQAFGTYAYELKKNGTFEIYDSNFEKYFWSEFPPIELKKAD